ncbi:MAG: immunity 26/phosphotriesterase HocA family protein [Thiobacillaceae bacterium]
MSAQRIVAGALVRLKLKDDLFCYGQVINKAEIAFFDFFEREPSQPLPEDILLKPILFVLAVMNSAIKSGRWKVIDKRPIAEKLLEPREYFIQDKITKQFSIYRNTDGSIRPANRVDVDGLECAAVWEAEHVEDRLRDHFAGCPNALVARLMPT